MTSKFFTLRRLYQFNIGMAIFNLAAATTCALLDMNSAFGLLFIANGFCFIVAAAANYCVIKLRDHSKK